MIRLSFALSAAALAAACSTGGSNAQTTGAGGQPFEVAAIATFDEPWAMTFLPGGREALIAEKAGKLKLWTGSGAAIDVTGVPAVAYGGQGGLGDVVLHPRFAENGLVYFSYAEAGEGGFGAVVSRGRLVRQGNAARLEGVQTIWRQFPKVSGQGHYGHRIAFAPDGKLYISSGDRQKFTPAQDRTANLGKILRLNDDGSVPADNPFASEGGVTAQIWSLGHRNPLGIAFDPSGRLWDIEMGPKGGDELNLVERGKNYGYPIVSNGDHYDGRTIPDHNTRPEYAAPAVSWTPVISPGNMIVYTGDAFPAWKGNVLAAGLSSEALVRVAVNGTTAREAERYPMGARIREVEQAPDGSVWLLEDGDEGRLLKLTPEAMSLVGHYERTLEASLERLYENVLDWEHLPHQHPSDFGSIALIEEGDWGWRAEVELADQRAAMVEVALDRAAGRWVTSTTAGGRRLSRIETDAQALGPDRCRVAIDFHVFGLPESQSEAAGRYYESLYARLYDEDETMMLARAEAIRVGASAHKPRRTLALADGRVVEVPLVCPHQALPLNAEPDRAGVITCPWHGYRFDAATGRNLDGKRCGWRA